MQKSASMFNPLNTKCRNQSPSHHHPETKKSQAEHMELELNMYGWSAGVRSEGPKAVFFIFGKDNSFNTKWGQANTRPWELQNGPMKRRVSQYPNIATIANFAFFTHSRLRWSRGSVLAFSTQICGFKPGRSRRIFRAKKSSARLPSEGK